MTNTLVIPSFKQFSPFNHLTAQKTSSPMPLRTCLPTWLWARMPMRTHRDGLRCNSCVITHPAPICTALHFSLPWLGNETITHTPRGHSGILKQFFIFSCQKKPYKTFHIEAYQLNECGFPDSLLKKSFPPFTFVLGLLSFPKVIKSLRETTNRSQLTGIWASWDHLTRHLIFQH